MPLECCESGTAMRRDEREGATVRRSGGSRGHPPAMSLADEKLMRSTTAFLGRFWSRCLGTRGKAFAGFGGSSGRGRTSRALDERRAGLRVEGSGRGRRGRAGGWGASVAPRVGAGWTRRSEGFRSPSGAMADRASARSNIESIAAKKALRNVEMTFGAFESPRAANRRRFSNVVATVERAGPRRAASRRRAYLEQGDAKVHRIDVVHRPPPRGRVLEGDDHLLADERLRAERTDGRGEDDGW